MFMIRNLILEKGQSRARALRGFVENSNRNLWAEESAQVIAGVRFKRLGRLLLGWTSGKQGQGNSNAQ